MISYCSPILPLGRTRILTMLGSFLIHFTFSGAVFWESKIFSYPILYFAFLNYFLLERGWPFIWTNVYSLPPRVLCGKFEIRRLVLERRMKFWKVYDEKGRWQQRQITSTFWSEKLTWMFGSGELKMHYISMLLTPMEETSLAVEFFRCSNYYILF